jgi:hypothetical protein
VADDSHAGHRDLWGFDRGVKQRSPLVKNFRNGR